MRAHPMDELLAAQRFSVEVGGGPQDRHEEFGIHRSILLSLPKCIRSSFLHNRSSLRSHPDRTAAAIARADAMAPRVTANPFICSTVNYMMGMNAERWMGRFKVIRSNRFVRFCTVSAGGTAVQRPRIVPLLPSFPRSDWQSSGTEIAGDGPFVDAELLRRLCERQSVRI